MSFREKSAWITLVSVLLCFGVYFGTVAPRWLQGDARTNMWLLVSCVHVFVLLQIGLQLAAYWTTPKDGRSPRDERERMIQARSHTIGYYLLAVLVLGLGVPMHLGHVQPPQLMTIALLDLVIAALVVSIAQIVMFRRGF